MNKFNSGSLPYTACLRDKVYQPHENGAVFFDGGSVKVRFLSGCFRICCAIDADGSAAVHALVRSLLTISFY